MGEHDSIERSPAFTDTRCRFCNDLQKEDEFTPRLARELTAEQCIDLEVSKSCEICSLIVEGIRRFQDSWSLEDDVSRVYLYGLSKKGSTLTAEIYFHEDRPKVVLEFYCTDASISPCEAIRKRTPVAGYPILTKGVRWVSSRLEQCLNQHTLCKDFEDPLLPSRTLYIERLSNEDVKIKLREHENETGRYTALSHCWGSDPTCITTLENLRAHKDGIAWQKLPATFRDALIFTFALGIHHLWVDSLCIIQDSSKDWEVESYRMSEVYRNAYLTLAATAASNSSEGLFSLHQRRTPEFVLPARNGFGPVMVRKKIKHWENGPSKMKEFPLLTRGWVLQERYLSPRTLHFCFNELVWECREDLSCECGSILAECDPMKRLKLTSYQSVESIEDSEHVSTKWHDIVEQYTALKVTKATDRLPALSGLARLASLTLGAYACGLWVNTIGSDLLWRVPKLELGCDRPTAFTGPSWSWASVDGPVAYWNDLDTDSVEDERIERLRVNMNTLGTWYERREARRAVAKRLTIRDMRCANRLEQIGTCNISLKGDNPFGEVISGRLRIRGDLRRARLLYVYYGWYASPESISVPKHDPLRYRLCIQRRASQPGSQRGPDRDEQTFSMELPFLPDYVLSEGRNKVDDEARVTLLSFRPNTCLVLTGGPIEYRRIGILRLPHEHVSLYHADVTPNNEWGLITIV